MRFTSRIVVRAAAVGAALLALSGCVAYPAGPYYGNGYGYGYGYAPGYYAAPPVAGRVYIGGGGWGWHHHYWR